jgi:SAM-dependent methyltransferase
MRNIQEVVKSIWCGKSLLRTLMNERCREVSLEDKIVLDLGSGSQVGTYHDFFSTKAKKIFTVDMKSGDGEHSIINFEKDALPYADKSFDVVLVFNVFEHIFNYKFLVQETERVLKEDGYMIGFVPFFIQYHPDPCDYFRYTSEALEKIFLNAGYREIQIETIGGGPFLINYNNIVLSIPKVFKVLLLPVYLFLDYLFLKIRPKARKRFPLGYFFVARK